MSELLLRFGMKLQQSYQISTFCARRFFWAKTFVLKKNFSCRTFFELRAKSFRPDFLKKLPRSPEENFHCKKIHFKEITFFLSLCRSLFRKIGKNVLVRCSNPQFNCPEVHDSWKNIAFGKLLIFFSNSDLEQILYESSVATFRQLRQNSNPSVHRNILHKKCSLFDQNHFFLVYGLSLMHFWTFKENFFLSFVNTAFNVTRGTIGLNFFPTKN